MFHNAVLIIDHSGPIESTLYERIFRDIEFRIRYAQREYLLKKINNSDGEAKVIYEKALSIFDDDGLSWLWIETAEPGSEKLKGKARNRILCALLGAVGFFATDVIDETRPYKDAKEFAQRTIDIGYNEIKEFIAHSSIEYDVHVDKENETVIVTVKIRAFINQKYDRVSQTPIDNT